jgi:hypothetical protein|nr:hypothetical protein [Allomuricauda sp.]
MENLKEFELKNADMVFGGELWETGCENNKPTDYYDDELDRTVYL